MSETYDCIVLGVGGFGSGAFYHLAKRGVRVLGLEQFGVAHDRGSSHGETRIIRKAYFEHPDYVPLAIRAYELWRDLAAESGQHLMQLAGVLLAGPPDGEAVGGAKISAKQHGLHLDELSPEEAGKRFAGIYFEEGFSAVHEPDAGYLFVERCVQAHIEQAQSQGGLLKTNEAVRDWSSDGKTVKVRTDRNEYEAKKLIITAGPWAGKVLGKLGLPLKVLRKPVFWYPLREDYRENLSRMPAFLFELPSGVFYGLPGTDGRHLKLAEHSGGETVIDPGAVDRSLHAADGRQIESFIGECLPCVEPTLHRHIVCLYTVTPDLHFVIDSHPQWENVAIGAGFSGHGFKFTGILGQALADLALEAKTNLPIEFLSLKRDALRTENKGATDETRIKHG